MSEEVSHLSGWMGAQYHQDVDPPTLKSRCNAIHQNPRGVLCRDGQADSKICKGPRETMKDNKAGGLALPIPKHTRKWPPGSASPAYSSTPIHGTEQSPETNLCAPGLLIRGTGGSADKGRLSNAQGRAAATLTWIHAARCAHCQLKPGPGSETLKLPEETAGKKSL